MVLVHKSLAVASCSFVLASAFVGSPPAQGRGRFVSYRGESRPTSPAGGRVRSIPPQQQQRVIRAPRPREAAPPAPPAPLFSSRTVDVDVIDVTDVTEEEARREKEQVRMDGRICEQREEHVQLRKVYLD